MASAPHSMFSFPYYYLLLFLLLIHETQSCPKSIYYSCPDHAYDTGKTSLGFPFTNISQPDCGVCVLTCVDHHTAINCMQAWDPEAHYPLALDINTSTHTIVAKYQDKPGTHDPCLHSNAGFRSGQSVYFTISERFDDFLRCPDPYEGYDDDHHTCPSDYSYVYGPFPNGTLPPPPIPPPSCLHIQVPNLTSPDKTFSIKYNFSDQCNSCLTHGGRCHDGISGKVDCYHYKGGNYLAIILVTVFSGLTIVIILVPIVYWQRRKSKGSSALLSRNEFIREIKNFETVLENYAHLTPKRYTHSNIKKMTNSFKEKLGEGGFGGVYKGKLLDGRLVAVKLLKNSKGHGERFINEVASIGRTNHVNIVTLLGFCYEHHKRALVYEYMANGSLEKFMHGGSNNGQSLPFETLFQIVLGIARGLEYLHRGCKTRILHFDIKPHNILLDEEFRPKISDFGLAKLTPQDKQSNISMSGARGTIGYIAPEVFCRTFGDVSHKSDVYSYGMMVLEVIGSKKKVNSQVENSSELYFPQYVYKQLEHGEEVETDITMNENEKLLKRKMIAVSLWCVQPVPSSRPSMSTVVQMLEGSLDSIDIPSMPTYSSPPRLQWDPSTSSTTTM